MTHLLVTADWKLAVIVVVFVGACGLGFQILRNWRVGIVSFFVWILFEDLIRKYLGNKIILYGAKDVIILMTYASYAFARMSRGKPDGLKNPIKKPLFVCIALAVVECFNLSIGHPFIPIVGLRMSFIYVPLLYLGYVYFDSEIKVRRFLLLSLSLAGVISLLGIIQSIVGLEFLNPSGSVPGLRLSLIRTSPESQLSVPRPTSVFVDAGRFAQYLFAFFFLGLGSVCYWRSLNRQEAQRASDQSEIMIKPGGLHGRRSQADLLLAGKRVEVAVWALFALIGAGLFVSAQRAALVLVVCSLLLMTVIVYGKRLTRWRGRASAKAFPLAKLAGSVALALTVFALFQPERVQAIFSFCAETLSPVARETEWTWRPGAYWSDIVYAAKTSGAFGHGTGTASQGLQYVYDLDVYTDQVSLYQIEGGFAAVIWEFGILGLIVWVWWTAHLVVASFQTAARLRGARFYWLALTITLFVFCFHYPYFYLGMQAYQNYVTNSYHWFVCGLLLRLPMFQKREWVMHER
jgi:hypothetical protein